MEKLFSKIFLITALIRYTVFSIKTGQRSLAAHFRSLTGEILNYWSFLEAATAGALHNKLFLKIFVTYIQGYFPVSIAKLLRTPLRTAVERVLLHFDRSNSLLRL